MSCIFKQYKWNSRVSSVLNKDVKTYGKKYIFDDSEETCWNSDQGSPQWIMVEFENEIELASFEIQFQGGFVGKDCRLEAGSDYQSLKPVEPFYPEDINSAQKFRLTDKVRAKTFKLLFGNSTDFFGRIIVYKMSFYS
ncbi:nuclear receptor 2C2-associated protein [Neodiprion pinetum]|uniref:Nuclear receptor 2C2-associated protein n=1 Tax=Neodiprion lecontei TaxID=441921 RepID=A0A6J0BTP3_NEOLC|nr:nuclear receptor 2C2-associated protein [Neodiprion lecontei]XP_046433549.1 nuclear receptor 2C2-associated protein [Neodiprion fabricii]XP_046490870.1 nuclear receptor 2C2-associated protein [Neodiprion pinetum]XP_046628772.1 nuclear receptor 2C2-associated protein [Neodiprion virginianus]